LYGFKCRLPTVAEWELAAGPTTYPWGDDWTEQKMVAIGRELVVGPDPIYAWNEDITEKGFRNMLGNVREMTLPESTSTTYTVMGCDFTCSPKDASIKKRIAPIVSGRGDPRTGFRYVIEIEKSLFVAMQKSHSATPKSLSDTGATSEGQTRDDDIEKDSGVPDNARIGHPQNKWWPKP
jgi:hypothetical protein